MKENQRGRFIKIAEISADGRKNQILMTFSTAAIFSQRLVTFIDFYRDLEKIDPENLKQGDLKSEVCGEFDFVFSFFLYIYTYHFIGDVQR